MGFIQEKLKLGWRAAKRTRIIPLGPIALSFRFSKNNSPLGGFKKYPSVHSSKGLSQDERNQGQIFSEKQAADPKGHSVTPCQTALVIGVGTGLGASLARVFSANGMQVALASRRIRPLQYLVDELKGNGSNARAYSCDATAESTVNQLFDSVIEDFDVPDIVVYSLQSFTPGKALEVTVPAFEESWRQNCLGGFIVAQQAAQRMLARKRGTIVLVGSTSSLIGRADHLNLAAGKFGLRAVAQTMAQELWGSGVHVVHVVIDAHITSPEEKIQQGPNRARPEDISDFIFSLHKQPPSAWSSEVDIRPFSGAFWEHC
jgi:NAD(P)-dependent dehydrogenase (short-subunit alcohol dehydrogenase family)